MIDLSTIYPSVPSLYRLVGSVLSVMGEDLPEFHRQLYQFYISSLIDRLPQLADNILVSAVLVSIFTSTAQSNVFIRFNPSNSCRPSYRVLRGW